MFADSFRPTVDGAIVAMETAAAGLEKRGHQIVILAPDQGVRQETRWPVHYLPSREYKPYPGYRYAISPSDMLEFLRKEKPDVIHSHGIASMGILSLTAARALKVPHVLTFHTMANEAIKYYLPFRMRHDIVEGLVWIYLRNLLKRPEVVIVPSAPIRQELEANGIDMKGCEVVPTGIDCTRFSPDRYDKDYLKRYGLDGKRVLLHVGRLSKEKRLDIVLGALAQISKSQPDLRLLVAGHGPAADEYKKLAKDLGISDRVVFAGFVPDDELPAAYASCEIMVIASTFETQGIVVLEALASGTPVAGIRYRAIPEFIEEGKNGCLFDEETCAEAILRCLLRSDSMMINAVSSARKYSVEACTAKLEEAYRLAEKTLRNSR
jgi:1,2-diacylglycerol 3-alpha-glucosyltransferase